MITEQKKYYENCLYLGLARIYEVYMKNRTVSILAWRWILFANSSIVFASFLTRLCYLTDQEESTDQCIHSSCIAWYLPSGQSSWYIPLQTCCFSTVRSTSIFQWASECFVPYMTFIYSCFMAGIMALSVTSSYYEVTEIATRILPNIVVLTFDPDR